MKLMSVIDMRVWKDTSPRLVDWNRWLLGCSISKEPHICTNTAQLCTRGTFIGTTCVLRSRCWILLDCIRVEDELALAKGFSCIRSSISFVIHVSSLPNLGLKIGDFHIFIILDFLRWLAIISMDWKQCIRVSRAPTNSVAKKRNFMKVSEFDGPCEVNTRGQDKHSFICKVISHPKKLLHVLCPPVPNSPKVGCRFGHHLVTTPTKSRRLGVHHNILEVGYASMIWIIEIARGDLTSSMEHDMKIKLQSMENLYIPR